MADLTEGRIPLNESQRKLLREFSDRVVGLHIRCTSQERPEDPFANLKGTFTSRYGTGFVFHVSERSVFSPCHCRDCNGKVTTHWTFYVRTAFHVVFNTEEAMETMVELFYDDETCRNDDPCSVKYVWAVRMDESKSNRDTDESILLCYTHDEAVAERIRSSKHYWKRLPNYRPIYYPDGQGLLYCLKDTEMVDAVEGFPHAVIFSHPHGGPKKITVGKWNPRKDQPRIEYQTPTCAGSSGAPVILIQSQSDLLDPDFFPWTGPVHAGTYDEPWWKWWKKYPINYSKSGKYTYPTFKE